MMSWRSRDVAMALALSAMLGGCAAALAAGKPNETELSVLNIGTHRSLVVGEFGLPQESSRADDGARVDAWHFAQGDPKWAKVTRVTAHILLDIGTLGLWEIVGTPTEILLEEDPKTYIVTYDATDRVKSVSILNERGVVAQRGDVGQVATLPIAAAATGSPFTTDFDRQANLAEIADKHGLRITEMEYNPTWYRGRVTFEQTSPNDHARVLAYVREICTSDTGIVDRSNRQEKEFEVLKLEYSQRRHKVKFRCTRAPINPMDNPLQRSRGYMRGPEPD